MHFSHLLRAVVLARGHQALHQTIGMLATTLSHPPDLMSCEISHFS